MPVSFGGVELIEPTAELQALIDEHCPVESIATVQTPSWSGLGGRAADFNEFRPVALGRLFWPRGASRFARGHFFASQAQIEAIRALAKPAAAPDTSGVPLTLTISDPEDAARTISTSMYMLDSRPMFRFGSDEAWLMTLVDARYFWWQYASDVVAVTPGTTTWANIVSSIGTALKGTTITLPAVDALYLKPDGSLATSYQYLPPLLDAVAYSIGRVVVRKLDGTVSLQESSTALAARTSLLAAYGTLQGRGGSFAMGLDDEADADVETWAAVPANVEMSYRQLTDGAAVGCGCGDETIGATNVNLINDLSLSSTFRGLRPYEDTIKLVRTTAIQWSGGGTEVADLAEKWATDWYLWRVGDSHRYFPTIVPWDGDGYADVEWQVFPTLATRVTRGPLNDVADTVYHFATDLSGDCVSAIGGVSLDDVPEGTPVYYLGIDADGCLVKVLAS